MARHYGLRQRSLEPSTHWLTDIVVVLALCLAIAAFVTTMFLLAVSVAASHEWYPVGCCSGNDCAPLPSNRVRAEGAGYWIDNTFYVPGAQVKESLDGRYHGCFPKPNSLGCFFAPKRGM